MVYGTPHDPRLHHADLISGRLTVAGFDQAPLAVHWEIVRIATQCNVNLEAIKLVYDGRNSNWHDQSAMRKMLADHTPFIGKAFPPPSDHQAWSTALSTFQSGVRSVQLKADLSCDTDDDEPFFRVRLHSLTLERGHRLDRRFGADRFFEILFPPIDTLVKTAGLPRPEFEKVFVHWLTQNAHPALGRFWQAFYTKSESVEVQRSEPDRIGEKRKATASRVYLFASNGNAFRKLQMPNDFPLPEQAETPQERKVMKRSALYQWAVAIDANTDQPMPKLFSRLQLSKLFVPRSV